MKGILARLLASVACAVFGASVALAATPRTFPIPDHGELVLVLPDGWSAEFGQAPGEPVPTVSIRPEHGERFDVKISPIWPKGPRGAIFDEGTLRTEVASAAKRYESKSVEATLPVQERAGRDGTCFYFSATDPSYGPNDTAPRPDDYKHLTMGVIRVGQIALMFTVLTNDGQEGVLATALEMVGAAEHHTSPPARAPDATAPVEQTLSIKESAEAFDLSVPVWRLRMVIPKGDFVVVDESRSGATTSPRYFHFLDEKRGIVISGWFESARSYKGFDPFWKNENAALQKVTQLPPISNVAFLKQDRWEAATYDLALPNVSNAHVRAEWVQAATWIDLHLSVTTTAPIAEAREMALAVLKGIRVTELN